VLRIAPACSVDSLPIAIADRGGARPVPGVTDPERELAAWRETVLHLHALGLPAGGVPAFAAAWLRRQGIRPDWEKAA
jgi:hypothetical protein